MPQEHVKTDSAPVIPKYRLHKPSGRAVVTLSGRDHYLGAHGSPESKDAYQQLVGRWMASGRTLADDAPRAGLSVAEVLLAYVEHEQRRFASRTPRAIERHMWLVKASIKTPRELYGLTQAASFGPKAVKTIREKLIADGLSVTTINTRIEIIKAAFRWAVSEELLPGSTWHALSALTGLRAGDSGAKLPRRVKPVAEHLITATLPHLRPPVRAIVELLALTGARPGEIVMMRTADIDTAGKVWAYRPVEHKTRHRGLERVVYIGPAAQDVLRPWLRPNLTEYVFQPCEDEANRRAELSAKRKTPLSCGNKPGSKRRKAPKRKPGERYDVNALGRAVTRACAAAGIEKWHVYQLRHSFATKARREHGLEAAQALLGHQDAKTTERYAEVDSALAREVSARIG